MPRRFASPTIPAPAILAVYGHFRLMLPQEDLRFRVRTGDGTVILFSAGGGGRATSSLRQRGSPRYYELPALPLAAIARRLATMAAAPSGRDITMRGAFDSW